MENNDFKKLVETVKKDPSLLHALAFEPRTTGQKLDFIPETSRTALAGMQAENLIGHALGLLAHEGCGTTCQVSCGSQTCPNTCGPTGNLGREGFEVMAAASPSAMEMNNPAHARFAVSFYNRSFPGGMHITCGPETTCCCTSSTCSGVTCGGSTCDVTCSGDSCGNTCGDSCGYTTNLTFDPLDRERQLAQAQNRQLLWR